MLARRLGLAAALVLLVVVVAASVAARVNEDERAVAPPRSAPAEPAHEVTAELPADETVRARVGDVVELTVKADVQDTVEIAALGESLDISPQVPAVLELVAYRSGTFPVTLLDSGRTVGRLVIAPAAS